jgi:hygromycin-B 7''-O-kinase
MKIPSPDQFEARFDDPIWLEVGRQICLRHRVSFDTIVRAEHGESVVLLVGNAYILKIYKPSKKGFEREKAAFEFVAGRTRLTVPEIIAYGEIEEYRYLLTTRIEGELMIKADWLRLDKRSQIRFIEELAAGLKELHSLDDYSVPFDWNSFVKHQVGHALERQRSEGGNPEWLESLPAFIDENLDLLPTEFDTAFMHGDVHFGNIRVVVESGQPKISGIFDFADSLSGFHEYEFIAVGVLMIQGQGDLQREFFHSYGYKDHEIDETLRQRMMLLTVFYEWSSLRRYAERLRPEAMKYSLAELERAIWSFA